MDIIVDTRETKPWTFEGYQDVQVISKKLDAGDYSLLGRENEIRIERKASTGELAGNFYQKYKQFKNELLLLEQVTHRYLVCEFPIHFVFDFPHNSGIPKRIWPKLRATGQQLMHRIELFEERHGLKTIFCGDRATAEDVTYCLLKEFHDEQN